MYIFIYIYNKLIIFFIISIILLNTLFFDDLMIASPVQILFRGKNRVIDSNSALLLGINLLIEIGR